MRKTCLSLLIFPCKHLWLHIFIKPYPAESINVIGPFKINTFKILFQEHYQSAKTVWIQFRTDILSVLSRIQTVCKGYHQTTKVAASKERVDKVSYMSLTKNYGPHETKMFLFTLMVSNIRATTRVYTEI